MTFILGGRAGHGRPGPGPTRAEATHAQLSMGRFDLCQLHCRPPLAIATEPPKENRNRLSQSKQRRPAVGTPVPRLAIESSWGAHPLRADRLARALAARSGAPSGRTWRLGDRGRGLSGTFRTPPAPYREREYAQGPGCCCVCGQPVYRFGWHVDLWRTGPNKNASGTALA